jgi:hypothetical protein
MYIHTYMYDTQKVYSGVYIYSHTQIHMYGEVKQWPHTNAAATVSGVTRVYQQHSTTLLVPQRATTLLALLTTSGLECNASHHPMAELSSARLC